MCFSDCFTIYNLFTFGAKLSFSDLCYNICKPIEKLVYMYFLMVEISHYEVITPIVK